MALHCSLPASCSTFCLKEKTHLRSRPPCVCMLPAHPASLMSFGFDFCSWTRARLVLARRARAQQMRTSKATQLVLGDSNPNDDTGSESGGDDDGNDGRVLMTDEEREAMRRKIREMLDRTPETQELTDPEERKAKMRELLAKYPLVVEEEDPDWPEDADGVGFNLDQFFDKITIKNVKKDGDDEGYNSEKEMVWEDDDYIQPIRDIKAADWEDTVFKDFGPLIILVHNRYKRPQENEKARNELVKAVEMFWQSDLPSPKCVAIDACVEHDLVNALQVSGFPEILFTNAGKILHREKVVRSAEDLSKMMAFFYYKAMRPSCFSKTDGQSEEKIPILS